MEKVKELSQEERQEQANKAFRETPLGQNITQLEKHVENHLVDMLSAVGIGVTDEQRTDMMTNFIAASHAAGTIQRLVWQQMDYEAKQREAMQSPKLEKAAKKAAKKETVKKNRPRGKTSMKKA
tara:strand:- start:1108 stop:1479 length:372 start_codon:yes stop_codon:yes gene_type:complete